MEARDIFRAISIGLMILGFISLLFLAFLTGQFFQVRIEAVIDNIL